MKIKKFLRLLEKNTSIFTKILTFVFFSDIFLLGSRYSFKQLTAQLFGEKGEYHEKDNSQINRSRCSYSDCCFCDRKRIRGKHDGVR